MSKVRSRERRETATETALAESAANLDGQLLIQQVGEELEKLLVRRGISRSAAARMFRRPESYIAERIRGQNMTLRTIAEFFSMLGADVTVVVRDKTKQREM